MRVCMYSWTWVILHNHIQTCFWCKHYRNSYRTMCFMLFTWYYHFTLYHGMGPVGSWIDYFYSFEFLIWPSMRSWVIFLSPVFLSRPISSGLLRFSVFRTHHGIVHYKVLQVTNWTVKAKRVLELVLIVLLRWRSTNNCLLRIMLSSKDPVTEFCLCVIVGDCYCADDCLCGLEFIHAVPCIRDFGYESNQACPMLQIHFCSSLLRCQQESSFVPSTSSPLYASMGRLLLLYWCFQYGPFCGQVNLRVQEAWEDRIIGKVP